MVLGEAYIGVYGGYGTRLLRLQLATLPTALGCGRRWVTTGSPGAQAG